MTTAAKFRLKGVEVSAEPFHYKMCGLDDVYLLNGFKTHETKYGKGVSIENVDCLHQVIGLYLIINRKVLGPKDLRFMRKNMKMTQDELASELGVTSQTVARYEKGQTEISGPVDKLMRLIYVLSLIPDAQKQEVLNRIQGSSRQVESVDEIDDAPVYFNNSDAGWNTGRLTLPHEVSHALCG